MWEKLRLFLIACQEEWTIWGKYVRTPDGPFQPRRVIARYRELRSIVQGVQDFLDSD